MATSPEGVPQSELARAFRALFLAELGSVPHVEDLSDPYQLVIPPAHADVGELRIVTSATSSRFTWVPIITGTFRCTCSRIVLRTSA